MLDKDGVYIKGSKTPKGRGNRSYISQKLEREGQTKVLSGYLYRRTRNMKEFIVNTVDHGLVTMMGYDYKDAERNVTDLLGSGKARKVELIHI